MRRIATILFLSSPVHRLGAVHGLLWFSPRFVIPGLLGGDVQSVRSKGGFNELFQQMIDREGIDIKFHYEVQVSSRYED